jgi:prepilin-type N-terminal cleavage/methylation domain-containing protein
MRKRNGFTLIELMIIVAIILLIVAITLPNLLRGRLAANESNAVSSLNAINKAQVSYQSTYPTIGYASSLAALGPGGKACGKADSTHACLIEGDLAAATSSEHPKNGYWFGLKPTNKDASGVQTGYVTGAVASTFNQTGLRDFCSLEDGIVRFQVPKGTSNPPATAADCNSMAILK